MDPAQPPPSSAPPTPAASAATTFWPWLLGSGAAYGLLMRFAFGLGPFFTHKGGGGGPMLASFLLLVPFVIGLWTITRLPAERRRVGAAIVLPWLPMLIFLGGTAILAIEGSICIVLALPLFMISASFGGLVALVVARLSAGPGTARAFLALPLLAGAYERGLPTPDAFAQSSESIHIDAPPERIWQLINHAAAIEPDEMRDGWAYRIGVPYPIEAITVATPEGRVRRLRWQQGVHFDEPILDWDENRYVRWSYRFSADSIPPGALDEHVRIGGRYFDLLDTSYRLEPEGAGTRMRVLVDYRVSTRFNWYAAPLGRLLVDDAARTILAFYKRRCEAGHSAAPAAAHAP